MANAEAHTVTKTKCCGVTLHLSREEALSLLYLTGRVCGSPHNTVREYTDSVWETLRDAIKPHEPTIILDGGQYFGATIMARDVRLGDYDDVPF